MTKNSCQNDFVKCHEIDGDWEKKKSPSEDPRFHLQGPWVKSDNTFPGIEDSRQTADLPGSPERYLDND